MEEEDERGNVGNKPGGEEGQIRTGQNESQRTTADDGMQQKRSVKKRRGQQRKKEPAVNFDL